MKKLYLAIIFIVLSSFSLFAQNGSELDNERGTSMIPIMVDADTVIRIIESEGFEIVRTEFDILKTEKFTYRTLVPDWDYGVFVFGDYRFRSWVWKYPSVARMAGRVSARARPMAAFAAWILHLRRKGPTVLKLQRKPSKGTTRPAIMALSFTIRR